MSVIEKLNSILDRCEELTDNQKKIIAMLSKESQQAFKEEVKKVSIEKEELGDFLIYTKGGKFAWYRFVNQEGRVRKCENEGCNLWLKYNEDKKTYEHWKYDVNTGKGGYVADRCEGVYNG